MYPNVKNIVKQLNNSIIKTGKTMNKYESVETKTISF